MQTRTNEWLAGREARKTADQGRWLGVAGLLLFLVLLQIVVFLLISG